MDSVEAQNVPQANTPAWMMGYVNYPYAAPPPNANDTLATPNGPPGRTTTPFSSNSEPDTYDLNLPTGQGLGQQTHQPLLPNTILDADPPNYVMNVDASSSWTSSTLNQMAGPMVPPTPQAGLRRQREDSTSSDSLRSSSDRRLPGQQMRNYATQQAGMAGLTTDQTKTILEYSELKIPEMLISLHVALLKQNNQLTKSMLRLYLRHPDFVLRMRNHVAAALLAVDVRAYVRGVLGQMMEYFEKNLDSLGLLPSCRDDPVDWQLFKSSVSEELSNQRSWLKGKLEASIKNKQDIYSLTDSILINGIKARTLHFARFAFLRKCTGDFQELPKKMQGSGKYWEFIDDYLADVRNTLKKNYPPAERRRREAEVFANILAEDRLKFSSKAGALVRKTYSDEDGHDWQRTMESTVRNFVVDDDDEVSEQPDSQAPASTTPR